MTLLTLSWPPCSVTEKLFELSSIDGETHLEAVIDRFFARLTLPGYWVYSVSGCPARRSTSQYPATVSITGGRETRATQLMAWSTLGIERRPTTHFKPITGWPRPC